MKKPFTTRILGVNVAVTNMQDTVNLIIAHIEELRGEFICLSNVHTTVMAEKDEGYRKVQNTAFLALPDGSPLALIQRLRGFREAEQVPGPDLMPGIFRATENTGISHFFYGSTQQTIDALGKNLRTRYPGLKISGMEAPPFRPLTKEED
ncbi:MAG: WecB/TagA/CpsF family glycosyltransferase, partial [Lachnospiraceae bacterium]|nr:WecB/TagA/CpsF family glycosyltransferase [Lachnospiraceae bacterium]